MFPEEKFSVVVLSNLATANPDGWRCRWPSSIWRIDSGKAEEKYAERPPDPRPKFEKLTPEQLKLFAGDYYSEELGTTISSSCATIAWWLPTGGMTMSS